MNSFSCTRAILSQSNIVEKKPHENSFIFSFARSLKDAPAKVILNYTYPNKIDSKLYLPEKSDFFFKLFQTRWEINKIQVEGKGKA